MTFQGLRIPMKITEMNTCQKTRQTKGWQAVHPKEIMSQPKFFRSGRKMWGGEYTMHLMYSMQQVYSEKMESMFHATLKCLKWPSNFRDLIPIMINSTVLIPSYLQNQNQPSDASRMMNNWWLRSSVWSSRFSLRAESTRERGISWMKTSKTTSATSISLKETRSMSMN